nr:polysaccharide biosynthesis/export family protein [Pedobacter sp. SYSU D00535]
MFRSATPPPLNNISPLYVVNDQGINDKGHIISLDDILTVTNLQNPDLISGKITGTASPVTQERTYRVEADGSVRLPVLGKVKLVGLSILDAERALDSLYHREFLKDPIIDISVVNLNVTILGEVAQPGTYLLQKEKTSLVEILGQAGGINARANKGSVKIVRKTGDPGNPEIIYVDLKSISSITNPKLNLRKNDLIYVEPRTSARIGDRLTAISPIIQSGLLVLNTALIILTLSR